MRVPSSSERSKFITIKNNIINDNAGSISSPDSGERLTIHNFKWCGWVDLCEINKIKTNHTTHSLKIN